MITTEQAYNGAAPLAAIEEPAPVTRDLAFYRRELMPELGTEIFKPNPMRLVWYAASVIGAVLFLIGIIHWAPNWPLKLACGLGLGFCNGLLGFLAHEILHGSVVKNQRSQMVLGFFGLLAFLISPTYWKHCHNRQHHGKTQQTIRDPDAFPTLRIYKSSKFVQAIFPFTPGSGYLRSYLYFFFWLSFHEFVAQVNLRFRNGIFDTMNHRKATLELAAQISIVVGIAAYSAWHAGFTSWLYIFLVPLAVQNYLLMSYISTNHNLSPLTSDNDPLVNSLTVTNHPVLEFFSLNFGYHVEHHLFPTVSGKHTKRIHHLLAKKFPDTYKQMPKWQAMRALYATSRIYKKSNQLIHPETLHTFDTL